MEAKRRKTQHAVDAKQIFSLVLHRETFFAHEVLRLVAARVLDARVALEQARLGLAARGRWLPQALQVYVALHHAALVAPSLLPLGPAPDQEQVVEASHQVLLASRSWPDAPVPRDGDVKTFVTGLRCAVRLAAASGGRVSALRTGSTLELLAASVAEPVCFGEKNGGEAREAAEAAWSAAQRLVTTDCDQEALDHTLGLLRRPSQRAIEYGAAPDVWWDVLIVPLLARTLGLDCDPNSFETPPLGRRTLVRCYRQVRRLKKVVGSARCRRLHASLLRQRRTFAELTLGGLRPEAERWTELVRAAGVA